MIFDDEIAWVNNEDPNLACPEVSSFDLSLYFVVVALTVAGMI